MNTALKTQFKIFLKRTFFVSVLFSTTVFAFLRLMVYPLPLTIAEDGVIFIKTILTGWLLVMLGKGAFEALVFTLEFAQRKIQKYLSSIPGKATTLYEADIFANELKLAAE